MDCMRNNFTQGALLDGRYKTVCPLNHGSFGLVFKAQDTYTGEFVALKCLQKPNSLADYQHNIGVDNRSEELEIHSLLGSHTNIVGLLHHFETPNHTYLVLEYCANGDLYESIRAGSNPKEIERVREAILQLIDAVDFMHSHGVYHRDIKPENIFLSKDGAFKIGDFGLATRDATSFEAAVGSDRYMAPEQMEPSSSGYSPAKADIWAVGICLLNILFARNPFATPTVSDPLFADFAADRQTLFDIFPNMSQDTFDILVQCLALDPEYRSLELAREAIKKAICFTTDNELLDDSEITKVPVITTANREPLRTPSITSPQLDATGAFPWAKNLALTAPARQLSVIADEDLSHDFFTQPQWGVVNAPDNMSMSSFVDSGLGLSVKSSNLGDDIQRSKPMIIAGSMPAVMARSMPNPGFSRKSEFQSKSWTEIFKDDDELSETDFHADDGKDSVFYSSVEDLTASIADSTGSGTPRPALAELNRSPNSRVDTPVQEDHAMFELEQHHATQTSKSGGNQIISSFFSPIKKSGLDKWAMLGDKRRQPQTPIKSQASAITTPLTSSPTAFNWRKRAQSNFYQPPKYKTSGSNWNIWGKEKQPEIMNKEWNMSQDWRKRLSPMADDRLVF